MLIALLVVTLFVIGIIDLPTLIRQKKWRDFWVILCVLLFVSVLGSLQIMHKAPPSPLMAVTTLFEKWGLIYPTIP